MSARDFTVYSIGLVHASVCTSLPREEVAARMNAESPAGGDLSWSVSDDATFADGTPHPCACPDHPETHRHFLMVC